MMHLCWKFLSSNDDWARLCRARFLRSGAPTATYIRSSVWSGIKQHITTISDNSRWLIGTGDNIYFWTDNWLGDKLSDLLSIPTPLLPQLQSKVSSFIHNNKWRVQADLDPAIT
jgi:hypothetical protein